jgi:butyryl-CoA dehydrogenase
MLRSTIEFLLYDWLRIDGLLERARYAEHSRETFGAVLDTCERIAREKFAPFNRLIDTEEPIFVEDRVVLPKATHDAWLAYAKSGMISAAQDEDVGGMQLPYVVESAANAFFSKASAGICPVMLTVAGANLLMKFGSPAQKQVFALNELSGRWAGTMCLSEPQAGSSLSDVATRAIPDGDDPLGERYRLRGNKMWISAGDHELTENIVHLVLAKIPGPDGKTIPGTKGISLFIVPKWLVRSNGSLSGERNDVVVAGLNHKCGFRGMSNALLNLGEGSHTPGGCAGAVGYLVGRPGEGLGCMFHMMNEARINVGLSASMLGYAGYEVSLGYARERPQGRRAGAHGKDVTRPQEPIIRHADVKRMLLAQRAYSEGAFALGLYCARLVDEQRTAGPDAARESTLLLEMLTPIAKSFPAQWCLEANSLAIQVLGGYGYTRDFPVEQYWRDNRLNMIHEGTHGIQGLDLLGRKVLMQGGAGLALLISRIEATVRLAAAHPDLSGAGIELADAARRLEEATREAWSTGSADEALANATPYLQAFGHVVVAWIWLDVALASLAKEDGRRGGTLAACRYFYAYELPLVDAWLQVVRKRESVCRDMQEAWF